MRYRKSRGLVKILKITLIGIMIASMPAVSSERDLPYRLHGTSVSSELDTVVNNFTVDSTDDPGTFVPTQLVPKHNGCENDLDDLEESIRMDLDALDTDTDFTLLIRSNDGNTFEHSVGDSSANTDYRSASTSKFETAAVILSLVKDGTLNLSDHPQDYIENWPTTGNLAEIELRHLLNFTSGLTEAPPCLNRPNADFEECVNRIRWRNRLSELTPGSDFHYGPSHMQVAGLMAIKALRENSWQAVFDEFRDETGLFPNSHYDLPSATNPRLAGGMHWTANDYLDFLQAIYEKTILTPELIDLMTSDQVSTATISNSPALNGLAEDWHYGFGNWIECHSAAFNCTEVTRISSPGVYGAYPFIDFENGYYGILAREGVLGTFTEGYLAFSSVESKLEQWAGLSCNPPLFCGGSPVTQTCVQGAEQCEGTQGNDVIFGSNGPDVIFGYSGNDIICGRGGDDVIRGGRGEDTIWGGLGDDTIFGGAGNDTLEGGHGADTLEGGRGNDELEGGPGPDTLRGSRGHDTLRGDSGEDFLYGQAGDDDLYGGEHDDFLNGNAGDDFCNGGSGDDTRCSCETSANNLEFFCLLP